MTTCFQNGRRQQCSARLTPPLFRGTIWWCPRQLQQKSTTTSFSTQMSDKETFGGFFNPEIHFTLVKKLKRYFSKTNHPTYAYPKNSIMLTIFTLMQKSTRREMHRPQKYFEIRPTFLSALNCSSFLALPNSNLFSGHFFKSFDKQNVLFR